MKTFAELKAYLEENKTTKGKYKGSSYKVVTMGSLNTLYVDDEKIDVYKTSKDAVKSAKEFIDLNR